PHHHGSRAESFVVVIVVPVAMVVMSVVVSVGGVGVNYVSLVNVRVPGHGRARAHQRRRLTARASHHQLSSPVSLSHGRPGPSTFYCALQRISPKRRRRAKGDPGKGSDGENERGDQLLAMFALHEPASSPKVR